MSTPYEDLQKSIANLVESKTLSLDAIALVQDLRLQAARLAKENEAHVAGIAELKTRLQKSLDENGRLTLEVGKIEGREQAVAKREATMSSLEQGTAVANARAETYKECVGLVFRNAEFRSSMFGSAPNPAYGQNNNSQSYNSTIPVNTEVSRTQT